MTPKEWLSKAIIRMILEDNQLHTSEVNRLTQTLKRLNIDADLECITDLITKNTGGQIEFLKLEPLLNVEIDIRFKMVMELAKTAALDLKIVKCEEDRFVKMASLLGFSPTYSRRIIAWAQKYVELTSEEAELEKMAKKDAQKSNG